MASGVKIDDSVKETYNLISMTSSKQKKLKYAIFTFSDDLSKIVVEKKGEPGEEGSDYETTIAALPANDVRYLAYDFEFVKKDDIPTSKMIFISWHPDTSPIKRKMLVSSSFNALKASLSVNQNCFEGDCLADINCEAILEKVGGKKAL